MRDGRRDGGQAAAWRPVALSRLAALALLLWPGAPALAGARDAAAGIVLEAGVRGTRASVTVAGCPVALESEPGERGLYLHYRNGCAQPLADKLALLGGLAGALLPDGAPERVTLFAGRLALTFPDIAVEAARAARRSGWDVRRARTQAGYANHRFARLVAAAPSAALLADALAPGRLRLARVSVEKVLSAEPARTPLAGAVPGGAPVPFDALTHFVFERR